MSGGFSLMTKHREAKDSMFNVFCLLWKGFMLEHYDVYYFMLEHYDVYYFACGKATIRLLGDPESDNLPKLG